MSDGMVEGGGGGESNYSNIVFLCLYTCVCVCVRDVLCKMALVLTGEKTEGMKEKDRH